MQPTDQPSTREQILTTAEALLRRFGPEKMTVVDVARALGMSHGNVYRHFPSKAALLDAVAQRWLHAVSEPLADIADDESAPADERLLRWLRELTAIKQRKVLADPEIFANYHAAAEDAHAVVAEHVAELRGQLARIIADGVAAGLFRRVDPSAAAEAVFQATAYFHHPYHVERHGGRLPPEQADAVFRLLLDGLRA